MWEPLTAQGKHGKPRLQWIEMAILGRRRWRFWGGGCAQGSLARNLRELRRLPPHCYNWPTTARDAWDAMWEPGTAQDEHVRPR